MDSVLHPHGHYQSTIFGTDGCCGISTDSDWYSGSWIVEPLQLPCEIAILDNFGLSQELPRTTWTSKNEAPSTTPSSTSSVTTLFDCKWKDCSSSDSCSIIEKHRAHLKSHAETAREDWKCQQKAKEPDGGIKCTWNGCMTKAKYKSEKLFEQHLVNIHINPLVCTVKHCRHTKPFRANHDLQRHIATAHAGTSKYRCPFSFCAGKPFPRKDKWIKHLHDHHDTEPCPYAHCLDDTFVVGPEKSTAEHIAKMHGIFECGLASCSKGKVSGFSDTALSEHLQVAHDIGWAIVLKARDRAKAKGDSTLRIEHLPEIPRPHWCTSCFSY